MIEDTGLGFQLKNLDSIQLPICSKFGGLKLTERSSFRSPRALTASRFGYSLGGPASGLVDGFAAVSRFMGGTASQCGSSFRLVMVKKRYLNAT